MLAAPDNFLPEDLHCPCLRQVHGLNNHHFELLIRNRIAFQVEQELVSFHIAAVCEIDPEIKLDAELGLRIGRVHELSGQLEAGIAVFHQLDRVPIRVGDPCLAGVVHA